MAIDLPHLAQWIGRSETREDRITAFPSNALAATLNRDDPAYEDGTELPPLWHWLHFLPISPLNQAGPDGHLARGGFLPPVPLPRRMWAGSRFRFLEPLRIGNEARRVSKVKSVTHKAGKSGDLVFVTVRHEVAGPAGPAIEEEHDIVYRDVAPAGAPAPSPVAPPDGAQWSFPITPDAVLLFRYSALTFNSHRIHFDLDYVTKEEGYPGLIVHGPLIATLLMDGLRRSAPQARITAFAFKAVSPIFHIDPFIVRGKVTEPGEALLWAEKGGALCMEATASFNMQDRP